MGDFKRVNELIEMYINVVNNLTSAQAGGKTIYIRNTARDQINFRANDFRKSLAGMLPQNFKLEDCLKSFRTMQFIVCETNRFTNTRYINGKTVRVITVDIEKHRLLKGLCANNDTYSNTGEEITKNNELHNT